MSSTRSTDGSLPVYREIGNGTTIIGVAHKRFWITAQTGKVREFRRRIGQLDVLAFEGNEKAHRLNSETTGFFERSYEHIAFLEFRGRKLFMDEMMPVDYIEMAGGAGVSPLAFGLMKALGTLYLPEIFQGSPGEIEESLRLYFSASQFTGIINGTSRIDVDRVVYNFPRMIARLMVDGFTAGTLFDLFAKFQSFLATLRDFSVYIPALEAVKGMDGKKGVLIGAKHIGRIMDINAGRLQRTGWGEFCDNLEAPLDAAFRCANGFIADIERAQGIITPGSQS